MEGGHGGEVPWAGQKEEAKGLPSPEEHGDQDAKDLGEEPAEQGAVSHSAPDLLQCPNILHKLTTAVP